MLFGILPSWAKKKKIVSISAFNSGNHKCHCLVKKTYTGNSKKKKHRIRPTNLWSLKVKAMKIFYLGYEGTIHF